MLPRFKKIIAASLGTAALLLTAQASAMSMVRSYETLIMYGGVEPEDSERFRQHLAKGAIKQVVLSESPGGDLRAGYQIADMITANKINTAVQGNCFSSCAIIFMAGTVRQMTASKALSRTRLGFHGPHNKQTHAVAQAAIPHLREWLMKSTDGKFPEEVLDQAMFIERAGDMMLFYYPEQGRWTDIRFCTQGALRCENVKGDYNIVKIGILTTAELLDVESLSPKAAKKEE